MRSLSVNISFPHRVLWLRILVFAGLALAASATRSETPTPPDGVSGTFAPSGEAGPIGSTGAFSTSVPIVLPAGRGGMQPSLGLSYNSLGSTGDAGEGWSLSVPSIQRSTLFGWPRYADNGTSNNLADEDRYTFGGQPLVYICTKGANCSENDEFWGRIPSTYQGYRYYRLQTDGSYSRFFLSPDRKRWIVQQRGGTIMEFGEPATRPELGAAAIDEEEPGKFFRWNPVRAYGLHGARNLIVYVWAPLIGPPITSCLATKCPRRHHLTNIYYTPPAANWASAPLSEFAYHVQLMWENPTYVQVHYTRMDKRKREIRLRRVAVAAKNWAGTGDREFVRAYNFEYFPDRTVAVPASGDPVPAPVWNHSFLRSVQVEGRCGVTEVNGFIPYPTGCDTLPATEFEYQNATIVQDGRFVRSEIKGVAGVGNSGLADVQNTALLDINRDGLPDIVQAWPQNFQGNGWVENKDECEPVYASETDVKVWFHVAEIPTRNFDPWLYCIFSDAIKPIRSAREHIAYVNRGFGPLGTIAFQHHCLDAGDGKPGTLTNPLMEPTQVFGYPIFGSKAALFSQWGAEVVGLWGDAALLWSVAGYKGYAIEPRNADPAFCANARGSNADLGYASLRWQEVTDQEWMKFTGITGAEGRTFVDVDGDGYLDAISDTSPQSTEKGFQLARVDLTRRLTRLQSIGTTSGPAVIPFSFSDEPEPSTMRAITGAASGSMVVIYADINGDGLEDMINWDHGVENGRIFVRPGNGRGHFGCEPVRDPSCIHHSNSAFLGSAYALSADPAHIPWPIDNFDLSRNHVVRQGFIHDVTGDGLADIVIYHPQDPPNGYNYARISLWINEDGHSFQCANPSRNCIVGLLQSLDPPGTGMRDYKAQFADLDGNGTDEFVILAPTAVYHFSFLDIPVLYSSRARGSKPGLLTRVRNGQGADTEIEYASVQELAKSAKFTSPTHFNRTWGSHIPQIVPVVNRITRRNSSSSTVKAPYDFYRTTRFSYRNPTYDLWERSFKGFRIVRAEAPSGEITQTFYWFGECESGAISKACKEGSDDQDDKSAVGLPVRIDRFKQGSPHRPTEWLSTRTITYGFGAHSSTVNGERSVRTATVSYIDDHTYDTAENVSVPPDDAIRHPRADQTAPQQNGHAHVRREFRYDKSMNLTAVERDGLVEDIGLSAVEKKEPSIITEHSPPTGRCDETWACLATSTKVREVNLQGGETFLRRTTVIYEKGVVRQLQAELDYPFGSGPLGPQLYRSSLGVPQPSFAMMAKRPNVVLATFDLDEFGNAYRALGPAGRSQPCARMTYDGAYMQFPAMVANSIEGGCAGPMLRSEMTYDRGLNSPISALSEAGALVTYVYDAFGRTSKVFRPAPGAGPYATELAIWIEHFSHDKLPWTRVHRRTALDEYQTSIEVFNGLGEHILGFDEADPAKDGHPWILRSWTERDGNGQVIRSYRPWFYDPMPELVPQTAPSLTPSATYRQIEYDTFGRPIQTIDDSVVTARLSYKPLVTTFQDAEQLNPASSSYDLWSRATKDGHGRVVKTETKGHDHWPITRFRYLGTGEVTQVTRFDGPKQLYLRSLSWDTFGRMVLNIEPNTSRYDSSNATFLGWGYVYDDSGRLVGTSDSRGCGQNIYYDALSRVTAVDYSPCEATQPPYSAPDLVSGNGTEEFYRYDSYEPSQRRTSPGPFAEPFDDRDENALGRLASIQDRGGHTRFNYDERGRLRHLSRRIVRPGVADAALASRYADDWYERSFDYDLGNRLEAQTTGLGPAFQIPTGSWESYTYSLRGTIYAIGSSYGQLISSIKLNAAGGLENAIYGDVAQTQVSNTYGARDRLERSHVFRPAAPSVWSTATPTYPLPGPETTQLDLIDHLFKYDAIGNPTRIEDASLATWPSGAKPVSRDFTYDTFYRLVSTTYQHGGDTHIPPFAAEALAGDHRSVAESRSLNRVVSQSLTYDAMGNITHWDDDAQLRFDRSLGQVSRGRANSLGGVEGPNQLVKADGIQAIYDAAGQMTELTVERSQCWAVQPQCSHRFRYEWNEVGQLQRAARWDFDPGPVPAFDPSISAAQDLAYAYSGKRVLVSHKAAGGTHHTLTPFEGLRATLAEFDPSGAYRVRPANETAYLGGVARVWHDRNHSTPSPNGDPIRIWFGVGDHLGSTSFVIDKATSEVVERVAYQAYGALDSDFRPERWGSAREEVKFTGKVDDVEVGLTYFGIRYYVPRLGQWASADPLIIHHVQGDLNPYTYVDGRVMSHVDPLGLEPIPKNLQEVQVSYLTGEWSGWEPNGTTRVLSIGNLYEPSPAVTASTSWKVSNVIREVTKKAGFGGPAEALFDRAASATRTALRPDAHVSAKGAGVGALQAIASTVQQAGHDPLTRYAAQAAGQALADKAAELEAGGDVGPALGNITTEIGIGLLLSRLGSPAEATAASSESSVGAMSASETPRNWAPESKPTWQHTFLRHGQSAKITRSLIDRARGTGTQQGQWLDNEAAANWLSSERPYIQGMTVMRIPPEIPAQVVLPSGAVVPAHHAAIFPSPTGGYITAYPFVP